MRLLLDTHVVIWLAEGMADLPRTARARIDAAAAAEGLAVSAITFWEVAMLARRGRLSLSLPVAEWRRRVLEVPGMLEVPLTGDIAIESVELPGTLPGDPADRIVTATARVLDLCLMTRDRALLGYGAAGYLNTVAV